MPGDALYLQAPLVTIALRQLEEAMKKENESLVSQRGQMFLMGSALFICLAAWSLSAFWQHIDTLKPTYKLAAYAGAAGGEVALFLLIILHCFNQHIGVRKWSLILSVGLGAVILAHTGALRGLDEATVKQEQTEDKLQDKLTKMSQDQAGAIADTNKKTSQGLSQRERLANENKAKNAQAEVMKGAQKELANEIKAGTEKIKDTAIFPKWYLDGWMYAVIFIASLASLCFVCSKMMDKEDIDTNFDGIPDKEQQTPQIQTPQISPEDWRRFQEFENARQANGKTDWPDDPKSPHVQ